MINTRLGAIASSKAAAPPITYYTIALSGSYELDGRPNDVDLYWDSGSGYTYVTTLTDPPFNKTDCAGITALTVASGSAIGFIKFVDPGNCDVFFRFVLNDPVCANYNNDGCEVDLGVAEGNTTHAFIVRLQNNDPAPPTFICC